MSCCRPTLFHSEKYISPNRQRLAQRERELSRQAIIFTAVKISTSRDPLCFNYVGFIISVAASMWSQKTQEGVWIMWAKRPVGDYYLHTLFCSIAHNMSQPGESSPSVSSFQETKVTKSPRCGSKSGPIRGTKKRTSHTWDWAALWLLSFWSSRDERAIKCSQK